MFFIKSIIIILILFLIIDLYIYLKPKSKLKIFPIKYNLLTLNKQNEIRCEFEITNISKRKETMIPNLNIELDFFKNGKLSDLNYEKEMIIKFDKYQKRIINYWPTLILKSNATLKIFLKIKLKKTFLNSEDFLGLKINWDNYGHFGKINKQDFFLLNKHTKYQNLNDIKPKNINHALEVLPVKTSLLSAFDEPVETVINYCKNLVKEDDILVIGESPLAIMQGRYENYLNIEYDIFSKFLCYFFHPTSSLATASGMQILINKLGFTRIIISLIFGFIFKFIGIKGIFYRLTNPESSLIDDISGTIMPYDKTIVLGPCNPKLFCEKLSKALKIDVAVADVNDLGGVKILASSNKSIIKLLKIALKKNPAGNADEKTPIVIVRRKA